MKMFGLVLLVSLVIAPVSNSYAVCTDPIRGINLTPLPTGWYNGAVELKFPTEAHIVYHKGVGFNAIRLPLDWDKMQPSLYGELNARYLAHTIEFLDKANAHGMKVLIDLHNYARYSNQLIGTASVPADAFKNIWIRLAGALSKHPAVYAYGIMNEPHDTGDLWHTVAQSGVDGIRTVDATHIIYVSGDSWSSAQRWPTVNPKPFVKDSANKIVYEAHAYFDDDASGRYKTAIGSTDLSKRVEQRVLPFLDWLKVNNQKGMIGEFGVPMEDSRWLIALTKFLDISDTTCTDWFIWAGGAWRETYELNLEPINGVDRPQIELIRARLAK
jgi:endoglucanase